MVFFISGNFLRIILALFFLFNKVASSLLLLAVLVLLFLYRVAKKVSYLTIYH